MNSWATDSTISTMEIHGSNNSNNHNGSGSIIEDQRALQLALELSMLGLTTASTDSSSSNSSLMTSARIGSPLSPTFSFLNNHGHGGGLLDNSHFGGSGQGGLCHHSSLLSSSSLDDSFRSGFGGVFAPKKSQNMTECVPVPSSEHVAEIVGRQGCKIKALRAKTNTYIKTPVRGEEPVFVVTGRKEDVALAKREILSAADHFTQIRASRKGGSSGGLGSPTGNGGSISPTCAPTPIPGQITIQVRVPYRVVGLVVGPKGATIKRIQQQTHTYIVTPSRDKDPVFEVTGLPESVQMAKKEIEAHIAIRTGSLPLDSNAIGEDLTASQTELLANLYKSGFSGLEALGLNLNFGLGLGLGGAINSLSSSLSSVSGLGLGNVEGGESGGDTVGSSSSGGGSLSSLSSLNGGHTGGFGGGNQKDISPEGNNMFSSFFDYPSLLSVSGLGHGLGHHLDGNDSSGHGHGGNGGAGGTVGSSSSGGSSLSSLNGGYNGNNNGGNSGNSKEILAGVGDIGKHHANNMFSSFFDYPSD